MSVPPSFAIRGKTCPGRTSSSACEIGLAKILIVSFLSRAEIPVEAFLQSTLTVNAVS